MEQKDLKHIVDQFEIQGHVTEVKPLGNGLINTTYKVCTEGDAPDYVLQHVNNAIFPDVKMLMDNIVAVTGHIRKKLEAANTPDIDRKVLSFIPAKDGQFFYLHEGKYWRIMVFIPDTVSQTAVTPETSYIVDELEKRAEDMCKAERLHREGKLPKRICHCDTKVDNILFDKDGNVLCVIDLDTVMPNFVFSDFGDFLRSAANTGKEDDKNLDNVNFNMDIFRAFAKGYIKSAKSFLTPIEIENLPYAATLFPYMQTVRFLADYINGDTYYKTQYAEHNLVRSKAQFKLLQSAEEHLAEMQAFINEQLN